MFLMMLMTANPKLTGTLRLPLPQRIVGWAATAVMFAVAVGMIATWGEIGESSGNLRERKSPRSRLRGLLNLLLPQVQKG